MPDINAISTAIAAKYAAGQVTPPVGLQNIRKSTAAPPGAMGPLPMVIVFPDSGAFADSAGNQTRFSSHTFLVRFYLSQAGDLARDAVSLQKWTTVLADQMRTGFQLSGTVAKTVVDSYKIGYLHYGGKDYAGVELSVTVVVSEGWGAVA